MKKIIFAFSFILLALILVFAFYPVPKIPEISSGERNGPPGVLLEKSEGRHRHVILEGNDFHRGSEWGRLASHQLLLQESLLISKLDTFMQNQFIQKAFFSFARLWFHDVDDFIDTGSLKEMYGVSLSAPKKFDYLSDGYTRQIAYHGLHEVGQMFVDNDRADMGCFASILPKKGHWYIGRNFDFDIEGLFDREKFLKWVYPDQGIPFLSITWAGMVGVVTGVNQQGLFVSINAAGSDDFSRVGTPTTIIVKNILQNADSLEKAISMLKESKVFITDIFILADRKTQRVAIVEKSPDRFHLRMVSGPEVISNHLLGDEWIGDSNNLNRKNNFTSLTRYQRGLELVKETANLSAIEASLAIVRDRKLPGGVFTYPGHRGAIDSFIASQSVIYDMKEDVLFVSAGPGTIGKYPGYDLGKSFETRRPVIVSELPHDVLSEEKFTRTQNQILTLGKIGKALADRNCQAAEKLLADVSAKDFIHSDKERYLGDFNADCRNDKAAGRVHWKTSLDLYPPFATQRANLLEKLK